MENYTPIDKYPYRYETHLHTSTASACGRSKGQDYIRVYKDLGYSGIIVTDHFFNGNCAISRDLPWEKRVELFCKGYEEAKEAGDQENFSVFFGWECNFSGDEYLVYGLDKQWLLEHPDILSWDHITHYNEVKKAGGLLVQAHPFRERGYLSQVNLHPFQCDAWEVANAGNTSEQDRLAYRYAKENGILMSAGSDIHFAENGGSSAHFGVAFSCPITSITDYVKRFKNGEGQLFIPESRVNWIEGTSNYLPTMLFDQKNKPQPVQSLDQLWLSSSENNIIK